LVAAEERLLSHPRFGKFSTSKFVADAASVRQQTPAMSHADAGSVGHDDANLEVLKLIDHWHDVSFSGSKPCD